MQAPIACNGLYPHFMVVTDPAKRAAPAPLYKRSWDIYVPMPISAPNLHFEASQTWVTRPTSAKECPQ